MGIQKAYLGLSAIAVLFLLLFFSNMVSANSQTIEDDRHTKTCKMVWEQLWPQAKNGDLKARFDILVLLAPPPEGIPFAFPGNEGDAISQYKDILIWGVYNSDYFVPEKNQNKLVKSYREITYNYVAAVTRSPAGAGASYLNCVNEHRKGCDIDAVKNGLVPSFPYFVKNVEEALQLQKYGTCKQYFESNKIQK